MNQIPVTDEIRAAAKEYLAAHKQTLPAPTRKKLQSIIDGERKVLDVAWWRKLFGGERVAREADDQRLEKLQAMADPARNSNAHERAAAQSKIDGFKASKPKSAPGLQ